MAGGLEECRYIDVVRFDGPLFFANASYLEDQIRNRRRTKKELKHVIISSSAVHDQTHRGGEEKNCPLNTVCQLSQAR